jgi:HlyD family secretion protein
MASARLRSKGRRRAVGGLILVLTLTVAAGGLWLVVHERRVAARNRLDGLRRATVHRGDMVITLVAPGWVESEEKTRVECELENLAVSSGGRQLTAGGAATILDLTPEGVLVRKDDVLCRLDASAYEELVRAQKMQVDVAEASLVRAKLDVQAAEIALDEYRNGTTRFTHEDLQGRLALASSDMQRQRDRLAWSEGMRAQGFVSSADLASEKLALIRAQNALGKISRDYQNFKRFGDGINLQLLEAKVQGAKSMRDFEELKLQKSHDRLAKFERQVERCTIRAPHDGFVIYANEREGNPQVEVGAVVRQKQNLFFLPDLTKMEIQTLLHESVIDRVKPGMSARVVVESLPSSPIEGQVDSVTPLPLAIKNPFSDLRNFLGNVKIHSVPAGMKPGMSAEVEIVTAQRENVLMLPIQAVSHQGGREICYVTHDDAVERRQIQIGQMNRDVLEVTDGLREGEQVVLEPSRIDAATLEVEVEPGSGDPRTGYVAD